MHGLRVALPTGSPAPVAGGPSLVAAGPVASRRHRAASPSPAQRQLIDRKFTMSKRTRALILGATLAAMNLAGLTAVAQAQANNDGKDARRPPSERQVGETWRKHQAPPRQQAATDDAVELFRRGERALQEQTSAAAALRGQLARERSSIPSGTPAQVPAPAPAEPSGQPGWLLASLGVLTAAMALIAGLVVMAAKRAGRRARIGHVA
jgi:hypothetical protein